MAGCVLKVVSKDHSLFVFLDYVCKCESVQWQWSMPGFRRQPNVDRQIALGKAAENDLSETRGIQQSLSNGVDGHFGRMRNRIAVYAGADTWKGNGNRT
jgi:hypothetical protein